MHDQPRHRTIGSHYTPDWIARWMVASALPDRDVNPRHRPLRILDPACGDGAFVLAVLDRIATQSDLSPDDVSARLAIVRDHAFGVDSDLNAINVLRGRVAEWIGTCSTLAGEVANVVASNFPCGDALVGNDWSSEPLTSPSSGVAADPVIVANPVIGLADDSHRCPVIDWATCFPHAAADGGFDLVIGNPPYRRERDSKIEFDLIAASTIGRRWRSPRMDLWHYFFHRGLDLLKPGGRLAFIVNSYWTTATGARSLRDRVVTTTTMEEVVMLGAARLFRGVSGQHMIFRVCKAGEPQADCQVLDLSDLSRDEMQSVLAVGPMASSLVPLSVAKRSVPQAELWSDGQLRVAPQQVSVAGRKGKWLDGPLLGEVFEVRQGIAENPPWVTKKAALELGDPRLTGRGVFVLTDDEVDELRLDSREQELLRPYYALTAVERFRVASVPSHQLLYLTKRTAPDLTALPRIARHLERFRPILERRREVQSGQIAWWHLHWPREERLFTAPRILCLQMGAEPRFAYADQPTYVGFSMHVIVQRDVFQGRPAQSLAALTAILNSSQARRWFEARAKRRGAHLDISGTVLKQFPLPSVPRPEIDAELAELTRDWSKCRDLELAEATLQRLVEALGL